MSDNISQENYWQLMSMYIDLGTELLLDLFMDLISKSSYSEVSTFLSSQEIKGKCIKLKNRKILNDHEYRNLFGPDRKLDILDISTLIKLLSNLFKDQVKLCDKQPDPKNCTLGADIWRMRYFRNKFFHLSKAKLCQNKFEYHWAKMVKTMLNVAGRISDDKKEILERKIAKYRLRGNDTDDATRERMKKVLEEWENQYIYLKAKANDLYKRTENYGFLFQSTPKHYIRYLKLLFECGKKVLLEILRRECGRGEKTLTDTICDCQYALKREITNINDVNQVFQKNTDGVTIPDRWNVSLLATVILISFPKLDIDDKANIEYVRNAADENVISETASKLLLETNYLFEQSTRLTYCMTVLSAGLRQESRKYYYRYIQECSQMEIDDDASVEKYLSELRNQGEKIQELDKLHAELIVELRAHLTEMENSGSDFKTPKEVQIKLTTRCDDKVTEQLAEDQLDAAYMVTLPADQSSYVIKRELDEFIARLSSHPDVQVTRIKRNCITFVISCSSCKGMLKLLDDIDCNLEKFCENLSDELSYIYNEAVVLRGNITFESILHCLENQECEPDTEKSDFNITLESGSFEGIHHVLATLSDRKTASSFKQISEMLSSQNFEKASVRVFPHLDGLSNLFEETESQDSEETYKDDTRDIELKEDLQLDLVPVEQQGFGKEEKDVVEKKIMESTLDVVNEADVQVDLKQLYDRINTIRQDIDITETEIYAEYESVLGVSEKKYARQNSTGKVQKWNKGDELYDEGHIEHIDIQKIKKKLNALLKKVLHKLRNFVTCLKGIMSAWKTNAKSVYFRLADSNDIDTFAKRCSCIGLKLCDLQHDIVPLLFNIYMDCEWKTNSLQQHEQTLDNLSKELVKSTFIITEQSDCFIRLYKENQLPVITVRLLAASNYSKSSFVEAMLIPYSDIKNSDECEDEIQKLILEKNNCIKLSSNRVHFPLQQRSASFKRLSLANATELEHGVNLYRVVLFTCLAENTIWTWSLPIAVLPSSNPDQEILPFISIVRNLNGTDTKIIQPETKPTWEELEVMLQLKFTQLCFKNPRPLSESNLQHLQECFFGKPDITDDDCNMVDISYTMSLIHNFWIWIHEICTLIQRYLLDFWENGLIIGFTSMTDVEWKLKDFGNIMSGTFIISFSEPDLHNGETIECMNIHLTAHVLTIQEKNVRLSQLETSKFMRVGKYLEEEDTTNSSPRWKILVQKCSIQLANKLQIESDAHPGIAFLNELKNHLMLPDLGQCFEKCGMHEGRDILHSDVQKDSVFSLPIDTFRQIGSALQNSHPSFKDGEQISCWKYIIITDKKYFTRKDQNNIERSSNPGEKILEVLGNLTIGDLRDKCLDLNLHQIKEILDSRKQEDYLEKKIVDIDLGGAKDLHEHNLVDILKEKRNTNEDCMLKYIYPGKYTLEQLEEKYAH